MYKVSGLYVVSPNGVALWRCATAERAQRLARVLNRAPQGAAGK